MSFCQTCSLNSSRSACVWEAPVLVARTLASSLSLLGTTAVDVGVNACGPVWTTAPPLRSCSSELPRLSVPSSGASNISGIVLLITAEEACSPCSVQLWKRRRNGSDVCVVESPLVSVKDEFVARQSDQECPPATTTWLHTGRPDASGC